MHTAITAASQGDAATILGLATSPCSPISYLLVSPVTGRLSHLAAAPHSSSPGRHRGGMPFPPTAIRPPSARQGCGPGRRVQESESLCALPRGVKYRRWHSVKSGLSLTTYRQLATTPQRQPADSLHPADQDACALDLLEVSSCPREYFVIWPLPKAAQRERAGQRSRPLAEADLRLFFRLI